MENIDYFYIRDILKQAFSFNMEEVYIWKAFCLGKGSNLARVTTILNVSTFLAIFIATNQSYRDMCPYSMN